MKAIIKKELNAFFASQIAYLVVGVYLVINGLFLWVFEGDLNILHAGFADLTSYFFIAPWIFLFLIPAITMRSFSEEKSTGTFEILKTKPISNLQIVLGKFFASVILVLFAVAPTITYAYSIYELGNPIGNINLGSTIGSFIGLLLMASTYISVGLFASSLTNNQIVAFIISVFICFFFFYGFEAIASFSLFGTYDDLVQKIGLTNHYNSLAKGVIDTRDLLYFITVSLFFILLTKRNIEHEK